jgi:predicted nucleic acid-binding protein
MYLVDTNVLSADAPSKARPVPQLANWMDRNSARLYLSVITVAEVEDGIAKARREGASRKAARLAEWLETLLHLYAARVLPLDLATARMLGGLADHARGSGHAPGLADLAIAATARLHSYTILTRNLRHFRVLGVPAHDPFVALPDGGT